MALLTAFQLECERALRKGLSAVGADLKDRREFSAPGFTEADPIVSARVRRTLIWIYMDGAEIKDPQLMKHFEAPDYADHEALIKAFVKEVCSLA